MIEKLRIGALVCTGSQRLARHISASYDSSMLIEGLKAWETPKVSEFKTWLASIITDEAHHLLDCSLLSRGMALALWEEVLIKDSLFTKDGLALPRKKSSLITLSYEAYELLKEYKANLPSKNFYLTQEVSALKRWLASYERLLKDKGFISPPEVLPIVSRLIESGEIELQGELILAGFEEITPALASFIETLKGVGVSVSFWPQESIGELSGETFEIEEQLSGVELFRFAAMREEVKDAACFAREKAIQGKKTGIIVANLTQYKELIEREFSLELSPASALLDGVSSISETFNISMAASLAKSSIVKSALELLCVTRPAM
ncbi:MAG: hypothetical protein IME98_03040, partial [Proteobacteria bacterium]|nr:hypothetical protein [Pseudomonadota bacterium]